LDITSFSVAYGPDDAYYRVSPKEVWQYDLTKYDGPYVMDDYVLLQTSPE